MAGRRAPRQQYTTAQLGRMSNKELRTAGFIRVAGFTRADGTKVKPHTRKLSPPEKAARDSQAARKVAGNIIDFVPIIGDAKAFIDSAEAFNDNQKLAGTVLAAAGVIGLVPFVGDLVAKPLKILAKTLKSPSPSGHDIIMDKILAGGKLKFDKSTSLINRPVKIPAASAVKAPATITRKSLVKAKQAEKKLEAYSEESKKIWRDYDQLIHSGKRTEKDVGIHYAKLDVVDVKQTKAMRELVIAKTGLIRETPALKAVRKDLYKQNDAINVKINKLSKEYDSLSSAPGYKKLDAKRTANYRKIAEADSLAFGGRSAKEYKAAEKILYDAEVISRTEAGVQHALRKKITAARKSDNPLLADALRVKFRKLLDSQTDVYTKEYNKAWKLISNSPRPKGSLSPIDLINSAIPKSARIK